jgi:DNA mismatch repair ATPase MutS
MVIAERDENGFQALSELKGQGLNLAANALAQSADHILSFFAVLRAELGFYLGCLNLQRRLAAKGEPVCFPEPAGPGRPRLSGRGLYDVCLSLSLDARVVGNDVTADDRSLVMITGPNQGGKSTFLRSIGLAQLMMQCGMFVAAETFRSSVCEALFTHYKREEDPTMKSGKLDEELSRMSVMADRITPDCLLLFNESFAATNEREGAEIASAIVLALLEAGVRVCYVTHSFELAAEFHRQRLDGRLFLRAERRPDGTRTFRLLEGPPQPTSHGEDLYRRIFGTVPEAAPATAG